MKQFSPALNPRLALGAFLRPHGVDLGVAQRDEKIVRTRCERRVRLFEGDDRKAAKAIFLDVGGIDGEARHWKPGVAGEVEVRHFGYLAGAENEQRSHSRLALPHDDGEFVEPVVVE